MKETIILILAGYALGCIPFSYIVGKKAGDVDIRQYGSGNTGATNVYRVLGVKAGLIAFIGDFLKGLFASLLGHWLMGAEGAALCGGMAMVGHCYPAPLKFKGGKGVSTSGGMVFGLNPFIGFILAIIQIGIIKTTRYVSLASIVSAGLLPVMTLMFNMSTTVCIYTFLTGALIIFRHRTNLDRLIKGTESKIGSPKKQEEPTDDH